MVALVRLGPDGDGGATANCNGGEQEGTRGLPRLTFFILDVLFWVEQVGPCPPQQTVHTCCHLSEIVSICVQFVFSAHCNKFREYQRVSAIKTQSGGFFRNFT